MCSGALNIIEIDYSAFFSNLSRQSITTVHPSEMFNTNFFNPIYQIKVGQRFDYKMAPNMGTELNGLFFPSNNPLPLDGRPAFFLPLKATPIPIGVFIWSSQVPKKGGERYG